MTDQGSDPMLDKWTDDQESALLRAVVNWKPIGMHKHFRMVAVREYMLNAGVVNPEDDHTSTSGIWKKLATLYNLKQLDEREDSGIIDEMTEVTNEEGVTGLEPVPPLYWREFELPRDDFEAMMWDRRLAPEGTSSPEMSRRESTVADTDEPRSSPVSNRGAGRSGRGSARKSGRLSRLQNELETERSSRRTSKAGSTADPAADEDQQMHDVGGEEEVEESETAEDEGDDEGEEEKRSSSKRGARGAQKARAGRRGRRRG